jgi:hypothetical protein
VVSEEAVVVPDMPEDEAESVAPVPVAPDELLMPLPVVPLLEPIVDDPVPEVPLVVLPDMPLPVEREVEEPEVPEVDEPVFAGLLGYALVLDVFGVAPVPAAPELLPGVPVCAWGAAHHKAAITALTANIFERLFIGISMTSK